MDKLKKLRRTLKKQHYALVGNHSGVQVCRWCKKSLCDEGVCYKEQFYGIRSHRCCQMSVSIGFCENSCVHCWRAIELTIGDKMKQSDEPKEIIKNCILAQRKLLSGFRGNEKVNLKKFKEAQEPMQFAISLTGEATLYPNLGELIKGLREMKKTSFLVTNGLNPNVLRGLGAGGNLPTQLYISMNSPNKELYNKWHRSKKKNAWEKFNESLEVIRGLDCRRVIRMTLVKGLFDNMKDEYIKDYVRLIKKANPDFIEVKGFMSVGFARDRKGMGYDVMPTHEEVREFGDKIVERLGGYEILDEHEFSRVVLLGKDKNEMKIRDI